MGVLQQVLHATSLQTTPNPFNGTTTVNLQMPEPGDVQVEVADVNGHVVETRLIASLQQGTHNLRVALRTPGTYVLTARVNGKTLSAKLLNTGNGGKDAVEYDGIVEAPYYDASTPYYDYDASTPYYDYDASTPYYDASTRPKSAKGSSYHPFQLGDYMRYVAYARGIASQTMTQYQTEGGMILLPFTTPLPAPGDALPCSDAPVVTDYDGNIYNTVKIGQQCWMQFNLRTTHYDDGTPIPLGQSYSETYPYYYDNDTSFIPLYYRGYLYNWPAVMHGASASDANPSGVQGICPTGWHVPSEEEILQLIYYLFLQSEYGCGYYGNIAKALASDVGWFYCDEQCTPGNNPNMNNATGFSAVPAGIFYPYGYLYEDEGEECHFWSSSISSGESEPFGWAFQYDDSSTYGFSDSPSMGCSVRCVKN
ncbi:MAG: T9SS type A sorting domain-containing protein [Bacteroidales bacterium]|nr:T9SS type A sorting domain-containing protein [Bacteroidales bacterium]